MSSLTGIGILNPDNGAVKNITLYGCGDLNHAGIILYLFYSDEARVTELINLGALSRLGKYIAPAKGQRHLFTKPVEDTCVAYHRDRGDTYQKFLITFEQYFDEKNYRMQYIYAHGAWYVKTPGDLPFMPLTQSLINQWNNGVRFLPC